MTTNNSEMINNDECKKKLKKVLSTKITTEDYERFRVLANQVYLHGGIKEDSPSGMLRFLITLALSGLHQ